MSSVCPRLGSQLARDEHVCYNEAEECHMSITGDLTTDLSIACLHVASNCNCSKVTVLSEI